MPCGVFDMHFSYCGAGSHRRPYPILPIPSHARKSILKDMHCFPNPSLTRRMKPGLSSRVRNNPRSRPPLSRYQTSGIRASGVLFRASHINKDTW